MNFKHLLPISNKMYNYGTFHIVYNTYYLKHKLLTHILYLIFYYKFCAKSLQHHIYRWYNFHLKVLQNTKIFHWWYAYTGTAQTQCSWRNIRIWTWRAVDSFIYRHISCSVNLTTSTSRIFTFHKTVEYNKVIRGK